MTIRQSKEKMLSKLKMIDEAHKRAEFSTLKFGPMEGESMNNNECFLGNKIIGTCSLCGGPVTIPTVWHGIYPATPSCMQCGAIKKESHGPIIDMEKPKWNYNSNTKENK